MTFQTAYLRETASGWLAQAPAKLNLYLDVLGKRGDGFHEVETLITPIRLFDQLHLTVRSERVCSESVRSDDDRAVRLRVVQPIGGAAPGNRRGDPIEPVPSDERNLVVVALNRLRERLEQHGRALPGIEATLWKRIPSQAGLGGGSSDAAAALLAGQRVWGQSLPTEELDELAAGIGSDVPVFLRGAAAVCRGRGERIEPVRLPAGLPCVLVQPEIGLGAGEVYAELRPAERDAAAADRLPSLIDALRRGRIAEAGRLMLNRLEQPAARIANRKQSVGRNETTERAADPITRLRSLFERLPVVAHQMSGSGSVYFGLCGGWRVARRVAARLRSLRVGWVGLAGTC